MTRVLAAVGVCLYPLAIFMALQYVQPRVIGAALFLLCVLRYWRQSRALWQGMASVQRISIVGMMAWSAGVAVTGSELMLHLMPVFISVTMAVVFGHSLLYPPSMTERLARQMTPDLPPEGVRYTRQVTRLWCLFFVMNAGIAGYTVWPAGREYWVWYNGLVSYLLMGTLFVAEWLYRRWRFPGGRA